MGRYSETKEAFVEESKALLDETEALLAEAAKSGTDKAQGIYQQVAKNLADAKSKLQGAQARMADKAKEAAECTDRYVHDHPWQAIGVAAAVGALVGMLIARK